MSPVGRTPVELYEESLFHLRIALRHAAADRDDQLVVDAVSMRLAAGVEALSGLDDTRREALLGRRWRAMWGMRNRIVHGYLVIARDVLDRTVEDDIPGLVATIEAALADERPRAGE